MGLKVMNWITAGLFVCMSSLANANIEIASHKLDSKIASQQLNVKIAYPWGYDDSKPYPVMYTTAGSSRFDSLVHQLDWLSHVSMGPMPQVVLVNIPQIRVESDLHPKDVSASGVANEITLDVLQKELMPFVNKLINQQGFNLIEGFSSNGNFPLFVFLEQPELFQAYLVHSPALVIDRTQLVDNISALVPTAAHKKVSVFWSLGPFTENRPLFDAVVAQFENKQLNVRFEDLSQFNFLTVANLSTAKGVEWTFSDLTPKTERFAESGVEGVRAYFKRLSQKYNKQMNLSSTLIDLAFFQAENGKVKEALAAMNTLVEDDPNNVFYLTRRAAVEQKLGLPVEAKQTLLVALKKAEIAKNEDALQYIRGELSKLN